MVLTSEARQPGWVCSNVVKRGHEGSKARAKAILGWVSRHLGCQLGFSEQHQRRLFLSLSPLFRVQLHLLDTLLFSGSPRLDLKVLHKALDFFVLKRERNQFVPILLFASKIDFLTRFKRWYLIHLLSGCCEERSGSTSFAKWSSQQLDLTGPLPSCHPWKR